MQKEYKNPLWFDANNRSMIRGSRVFKKEIAKIMHA